jgi:phosphoenolpyruvate carboxykinase (GTP)
LGITNPQGEKKYIAAAFPSACGKTNLAMLSPALPGWKIECVGDDIAWMRFGQDGRLYAMNPEAGFFGVAPGTSFKTNPHAMMSLSKNTIFTNVGLTEEKDIWWEAMSPSSTKVTTWLGEDLSSEKKAAHANARFTAPASQCPIIDAAWQHPEGVPISAILFGGRRESVIPLVFQSFDWNHGVFLGASISSQMTAAAQGTLGKLRHDPFAMLPFCGYHMGEYFSHWIKMGKNKNPEKLPKIFYVNWFQKENDQFIWPGYGDNIRALQWIFDRTSSKISANKTPIGYLPNVKDIDLSNLSIQPNHLEKLLSVDTASWKEETKELENYFTLFGDKFPEELKEQLKNLKERLE